MAGTPSHTGLPGQFLVGLAVIAHTARRLLTAGAGLLTACTPRAWPLITGIVLLAARALMTLLGRGSIRRRMQSSTTTRSKGVR